MLIYKLIQHNDQTKYLKNDSHSGQAKKPIMYLHLFNKPKLTIIVKTTFWLYFQDENITKCVT